MTEPIETRQHMVGMGGVQKIYRFDNNYGASVVRFQYSYGYEKGLWELAVIGFPDDSDDYRITYETYLTDDVIGYLSDKQVEETLIAIQELPMLDKIAFDAEQSARDALMRRVMGKGE